MVSSHPQFAPNNPTRRAGASQITTGGPPPAGTFFSLLSAQKPIHWPSGEKKGPTAPSVPAIAVASTSSNRRLKSSVTVPRTPLKTIVRPSGDNAMAVRLGRGEVALPLNRSAGRTSKSNFVTARSCGGKPEHTHVAIERDNLDGKRSESSLSHQSCGRGNTRSRPKTRAFRDRTFHSETRPARVMEAALRLFAQTLPEQR